MNTTILNHNYTKMKHLSFLLLFFFVFSCAKDKAENGGNTEQTQDLGDKYVLVHCVLHTQYPKWPEPSLDAYGNKIAYSDYCLEPDVQRLYLCYNTFKDGKPEKLESATPALFDNTTGVLVGNFERVSDYEWQLKYLPGENTAGYYEKRFYMKFRLEISGVPGKEKITAMTEFEGQVAQSYYTVDYESKYFDSYNNKIYHVFTQTKESNRSAWLFLNSYNLYSDVFTEDENILVGIPFPIVGAKKTIAPSCLRTSYPYCDQFNFSKSKNGYLYALRLLAYDKSDNNDCYSLSLEPFEYELKRESHYYIQPFTEATICYVSDDYDKFLTTGITYCINNNVQPSQHEGLPGIIPNKDIFSNIKGGQGIFGIQIVTFLNDKWDSSGTL